jgi:4-hydroxybenzoyl-CoA reductase subunit beta
MTLRLPKFSYIAPRSLEEATGILAEEGPRAMLVAGGTDLYPNMKRRQFTPEVLVGLRGVAELRGVRPDSQTGALRIGAGVTLTDLESHPIVRERYPALANAASLVSTPQLRNMGTIGGNICLDTRCNWYDQSTFWRKAAGYCMKLPGASPSLLAPHASDIPCRVATTSPRCLATFSADTVPTLIGYDASVRLVNADGDRTVALRDLYQMDGMRWLKIERGEIVTDVTIPDPEGLRAVYLKLRDRDSFDFPMAGVFVGIRTSSSGLVDRARMVLTGVYSQPVELTEAQDVVTGQPLGPDVIAAAAEAAYEASRPVDNTGGTIIQRRRTIRVFVRRALETLAPGVAVSSYPA